jgi:hypothetical protein
MAISRRQELSESYQYKNNVKCVPAFTDQGLGRVLAKGDKDLEMPKKRYLEEYGDDDSGNRVPMACVMLVTYGGCSSAYTSLQSCLTIRCCMALQGAYSSIS